MEKEGEKVAIPMLAFDTNISLFGNRKNAGFTLLEIILVLSIIGFVSILIFPNVGTIESRTFNSQLRQIVSLLNYAKRTAVIEGRSASVEIYAMPMSELETAQSPVSVGYWEFTYGSIRFEDNTEIEHEIGDKLEVIFYPEGGSTGGTIFLGFEEEERRIQINPFSGEITIKNES